MSDCQDLVVKRAKENNLQIPEEHLRQIVQEFEKQIKGKKIYAESDYDKALSISIEKVRQKKIAARQMKLEAMLRTLKVNDLLNRVEKYDGRPEDALLTFLRGESKMRVGSRDSLTNKQQGLLNFHLSRLGEELQEADLLRPMQSGELDGEIYLYAYSLEAGRKPENIKVSYDAKKAYEIIFGQSNARREQANRAGAFIGKRNDRIVTQSHDMVKISKAGFETWRDDFMLLVDKEKTFAEMDEAEVTKYVKELYDRFVTGKHYLADDGRADGDFSPSSANLARRISQSRHIHFKTGSAAYKYAQKYAEGNLFERLFLDIRRDVNRIVLLENLGPNPKAVLDGAVKRIEQMAQERQEVIPDQKLKAIQTEFDYFNGLHDIPSNITLAEIGHTTRALESMSKLGGAVLAAGPDLVFKGATLNRRTDMGFFGSMVKGLTDVVGSVPKKDREHIANMFGMYGEVLAGKVFSRVGQVDGMPGRMSQLQQLFFRLNLLQGWTVSHKKGIVTAHAYDLARYREVDFDQLPPNTKRNLELYNISGDEWNILRFGETLNPETGNHFITPNTIDSLSNDIIDPVISRITQTTEVTDGLRAQFRDTIRTKFLTMASDIADEGVVTPSQRERVLLTLGTQKGTVLGEFMRFVSQFKAFPLTVITKQMMPQYHAAGGGMRGAASLVPIIVATTAMGYLSGAAKDLAKGREPRDPKDAKTWGDAMVRGGGLGLFGDFMFAEYSRYGRSFQESLLGPGIGTFSDGLALAHKSATLNADAGDYFRFMKNITPGQNLFYTEAAFNYLFFYGLMEMNEPGYISRMERQRRKDYDQDFWLDPSETSFRPFD